MSEMAPEAYVPDCKRCRDFRRDYGNTCNDLRDAARKLVRSNGAARYQERVDRAKAAKAEAARLLNDHVAIDHDGEAA